MLYDNYVERLSKRYLAELESIKAGYNFDLGDEYEIAVCRVLRLFLPTKYGVCRGHIVAKDGTQVGDDIIIYDKSKFPTLGLRDENDLSRKEFIPIEAVFCYIEAKNSLDEKTLSKGLQQVSAAKTILSKRPKVSLGELDGLTFDESWFKANDEFPQYKNPPWGAIISNNMTLTTQELIGVTKAQERVAGFQLPDLILCGKDKIVIPTFRNHSQGVDRISSFSIEGRTSLTVKEKDGQAPGIAMLMLLSTLEWLKLGSVTWTAVVVDALNEGGQQ